MGLRKAAKRIGGKIQGAAKSIGGKLQDTAKDVGRYAQGEFTKYTGIETPYTSRDAASSSEAKRRMMRYMKSRMAGGGTVNTLDEKEETV